MEEKSAAKPVESKRTPERRKRTNRWSKVQTEARRPKSKMNLTTTLWTFYIQHTNLAII